MKDCVLHLQSESTRTICEYSLQAEKCRQKLRSVYTFELRRWNFVLLVFFVHSGGKREISSFLTGVVIGGNAFL